MQACRASGLYTTVVGRFLGLLISTIFLLENFVSVCGVSFPLKQLEYKSPACPLRNFQYSWRRSFPDRYGCNLLPGYSRSHFLDCEDHSSYLRYRGTWLFVTCLWICTCSRAGKTKRANRNKFIIQTTEKYRHAESSKHAVDIQEPADDGIW